MTHISTYEQFRFTQASIDEAGVARLSYAFDDQITFEELINFGPSNHPLSEAELTAQENALRLLHILAGVSYYKAFIPTKLIYEGARGLTEEEKEFFWQSYFHGLGEFAYRNELDLSKRLNFSSTALESNVSPTNLQLSEGSSTCKSLVPIGGGKDSVVTLELLKSLEAERKIKPVAFVVNPHPPMTRCIEAGEVDAIVVKRRLDPQLFKLNEQGALNGHIPITAINSAIAVIAAIRNQACEIAFSNERSANEGNLTINGVEVNHQYSKSFAFEQAFANHIKKHVVSNLSYYSALRPLSEFTIAQLFLKETRYDKVFTSCNRAFRIDPSKRYDHWCGECDKCRFVYLIMAPHTNPDRLNNIFGKNLLEDESQLDGFKGLLGIGGSHKPWDCVGEYDESRLSLKLLSESPLWKDTFIVKSLAHHPELQTNENLQSQLETLSPEHAVPATILTKINAWMS